jgi:hypothetical protein
VRDTDGNDLAIPNSRVNFDIHRDHELSHTDGSVDSIAEQRWTSWDHLPHRGSADRREGRSGRDTDPNRPVLPVHD